MAENNRTKSETLAYLRQKIQQLEGFKSKKEVGAVRFGIPAMDEAFPEGEFPVGVVHEFVSMRQNIAPTLGFAAAIMSSILSRGGAVLWITKSNMIFAPGLVSCGLKPDRITFMEVRRDQEALWAMEEGLRAKGLAIVVGEIQDADLTATRRLQLAVEDSGVTGFLMRIDPRKTGSSSCVSSWSVSSLPSQFDDGMPGIGFPRWDVELTKVRNGTPGRWQIEWRAGQFYLADEKVVPAYSDNIVRLAV